MNIALMVLGIVLFVTGAVLQISTTQEAPANLDKREPNKNPLPKVGDVYGKTNPGNGDPDKAPTPFVGLCVVTKVSDTHVWYNISTVDINNQRMSYSSTEPVKNSFYGDRKLYP